MRNPWITAFPEDGKGFMLVSNLLDAARVYQYCMMAYVRTTVIAYTACGNEIRRWKLTNRLKVETLRGYLINNAYNGRLRIKVKSKRRHKD